MPARRDVDDAEVLRGKALFYAAGCAACHRPSFVTGAAAGRARAFAASCIWPYTDLLLHDMGEGLADDRPEGDADRPRMAHAAALGHRPAPQTVSGHTQLPA